MFQRLKTFIIIAALINSGHAAAFPPLNVSIRTDDNVNFEAGSPRVLACIVFSGAPSANVTWYIGDTMLRPNVYKEVNRGNFTVSSLTFVPSLTDNGKELVCKVTNGFMAETFEDRVTVSVGHRPMCVDSGFQNIAAVEGQSATLVCKVISDPEPEQFIWTFADGRTIYTTGKKVSGYDTRYSTTLVWVARVDDFGPLYCRASNRFGEQKQPCTFSVIKDGPPTTPICDKSWEDQETLKVRCEKKNATMELPENYSHGEDMPPITVFESTANISIIGSMIILISLFSGLWCFVRCQIMKKNNVPDIVHITGSASSAVRDRRACTPSAIQNIPMQQTSVNFIQEFGGSLRVDNRLNDNSVLVPSPKMSDCIFNSPEFVRPGSSKHDTMELLTRVSNRLNDISENASPCVSYRRNDNSVLVHSSKMSDLIYNSPGNLFTFVDRITPLLGIGNPR